GEAEPKVQDFPFARPQVFHEELQRLLTLRNLAKGAAFVVGHSFGEFEIAVVVQNRVQRHGSARRRLQVSEMFKAAASSRGKFLGTRKMLTAMSQRLRLLL